MPVQTKVLNALAVLFVVADGIGLENQVQHHEQANEDVKAVSTRRDVEDGTGLSADGEAFCNEVAPLNEFEHNKHRTQ